MGNLRQRSHCSVWLAAAKAVGCQRRRLRRAGFGQIDVSHLSGQFLRVGRGGIAQADHCESLLGKANYLYPETKNIAVVPDGFQSLIRSVDQTKGVGSLLAVVELCAPQHRVGKSFAADFAVIKVLIPLSQIFDRRQQIAGPHGFDSIDELAVSPIALRLVTDDTVFDHRPAIVVKVSIGHTQWAKDVFLGELA